MGGKSVLFDDSFQLYYIVISLPMRVFLEQANEELRENKESILPLRAPALSSSEWKGAGVCKISQNT